jgi:hypothetical protein
MECCYYGGIQSVKQQAQIRAGFAAKQAELMLDGNHINVAEVNIIGGADIIVLYVLTDFKLYGIIIL